MEPEPVSLTVNLGLMVGVLQTSLQRVIDLVSFGMQAAANARDIDRLELPGVNFHMILAGNRKLDVEHAREEFQKWIVGAGLRECAEAINPLLEEARNACAVYRFAGSGPTILKVGELKDKLFGAQKKFHRDGLPDKIETLKKEYDPGIIPELTDHILSINKARNCLVHRRGIITKMDFNTADSLFVRWKKMELIARDEEGNEEVFEIPFTTKGDTTISMKISDTSRIFRLGEAIIFSPRDFSSMCTTFFFFAQQLVENLKKYGESKGVPFMPST
jgi:hypothetical protein